MKMARTKSRVSTYAIAETVGVSQATVAKVLNRTPSVKYAEETVKRILEAADRMGYPQYAIRRAIKTPLKHIALVISGVDMLGVTGMVEMFQGICDVAAQRGYFTMVCEAPGDLAVDAEREKMSQKILDLGHSGILDGLLIDKSHFAESQMAKLSSSPVPCVYINGRLPRDAVTVAGSDADEKWNKYMVCIDHRVGGQMATEHLLRLGHRRIAVIAPIPFEIPYGAAMLQARATGFRDAYARWGLEWDPELIGKGSLTDPKVVIRTVDYFLGMHERPTAMYVADDAMALLTINHLRRRGLSVPEDMSVVGYGGMSGLIMSEPELTTVRAPWRRMGELGAQMLISLLAGDPVEEESIVLAPELVHGETAAVLAPNSSGIG